VFWGDHFFVPAVGHLPSGLHHVDILAQMGPVPSEHAWKQRGLDKYGLVIVNERGEAAQIEKVSFTTAGKLLATFGQTTSIGPARADFAQVDAPPRGFPPRDSTTANMFASVRCAAVVFNLCVQHVLSST